MQHLPLPQRLARVERMMDDCLDLARSHENILAADTAWQRASQLAVIAMELRSRITVPVNPTYGWETA